MKSDGLFGGAHGLVATAGGDFVATGGGGGEVLMENVVGFPI